MHYLFIVLIVCLVIFLYSLHLLTEDDFVIMRKNASVEKVFNAAFLTVFIGLLFSRIFYVLLYPKRVFFEPLGFLIFPYFPGLSLIGGILGGVIFFWLYSTRSKLPTGRIFDFFAGSFLAAAPFGVFGVMILNLRVNLSYAFDLVAFSVLLIIAILFFKKGEWM